MSGLWAAFEPPFMSRALLALVVLGTAAAVVSYFVLLRRLAFTAEAMTHTVLPGVVIGYLAAGETGVAWGGLLAALGTAVVVTGLARSARTDHDATTAIVLTAMFSIGVALVSRRASFTADLTAFLFGRLLTVTAGQVGQAAAFAALAVALLAATAKEQRLRAFDPVGAGAAGLPVRWLDLALNVAVALMVVACARSIGVLLVVALLVVPAAIGRLLTIAPLGIIGVGMLASVGAAVLGLAVSYQLSVGLGVRLAAAPAVALGLGIAYLTVAGLTGTIRRVRQPAGVRR